MIPKTEYIKKKSLSGRTPAAQNQDGCSCIESIKAISSPDGTVQMLIRTIDDGTGDSAESIHKIAREGVRGAGSPMPHADALQKAFPNQEVGNVQAYTGRNAQFANEKLGAHSYATHDNGVAKIAFGKKPDLRLAAHEVAHLGQQRQGVQLQDGIGKAGDRYEVAADIAADRAVGGKIAQQGETQNNPYSGSLAFKPALQAKIIPPGGDEEKLDVDVLASGYSVQYGWNIEQTTLALERIDESPESFTLAELPAQVALILDVPPLSEIESPDATTGVDFTSLSAFAAEIMSAAPPAAKDLATLFAIAEKEKMSFAGYTKYWADQTNGTAYLRPGSDDPSPGRGMKKMGRAAIKAAQKGVRAQSDIVASTIAYPSLEAMLEAIRGDENKGVPSLEQVIGHLGCRIERVKNRAVLPAKPHDSATNPEYEKQKKVVSSNRDMLLNIRMPSGFVAELQIHFEPTFAAKQLVYTSLSTATAERMGLGRNVKTHDIYDIIREVEQLIDKLTPFDLVEERLSQRSASLRSGILERQQSIGHARHMSLHSHPHGMSRQQSLTLERLMSETLTSREELTGLQSEMDCIQLRQRFLDKINKLKELYVKTQEEIAGEAWSRLREALDSSQNAEGLRSVGDADFGIGSSPSKDQDLASAVAYWEGTGLREIVDTKVSDASRAFSHAQDLQNLSVKEKLIMYKDTIAEMQSDKTGSQKNKKQRVRHDFSLLTRFLNLLNELIETLP